MNASHLSSIGANVRRYRKNRKWTQEELARKADISRIALIHIESSKAIPTLDTLSSLSNVLEIPMTALFTKADKPVDMEALGTDEFEMDAIDTEIRGIVSKLRGCSLSQMVTLRKLIDTVLVGYQDRVSEVTGK
jgi:transcriptional regulator with XRE-family HTH domain